MNRAADIIERVLSTNLLMPDMTVVPSAGADPQAVAREEQHLPRALYIYRVHAQSISAQKRVDQILASQRAIERALVRRKMDQEFELNVEIVGRFNLRRKTPRGG